ncbi:NAD(P)H-binding protein [Pseudodesulfovibrio sp. F-1]|uniref:NAD(P)H-binding protein n=1 Tax=Pseudodesulfovibrio alkaliphilus TaxID=2661613 RepID=A0A7K1KR61_9BACT|nr:NmrA family NAD(P)-binding protein [Pseudodesulfovibrio alkaliphilus]MUM78567.1 NAD(P)H-binding protein [Pseudodesulfovibrio alkaliphilus]
MGSVFVAGATGVIGSAVLAALGEAGADVVAGTHIPEEIEPLAREGVQARVFDFSDQESMVRAMQGCDRLFLTLPLAEGMTRRGHLAVQAAKAAGIGHIVRSSAYAASSDAHWRLGREHGTVDQFVEDSGIPFTILRPNSVMQRFVSVLAPMVRSGVLALPEEYAKVSYIDACDIGACAARLLLDGEAHHGRTYALTGPQGISLAEVAAILSGAIGREVVYRPVDESVYVENLSRDNVPEWTVNMLVSLTRVVKLGMMGNVTGAVAHLTGGEPRSFAAFASDHAGIWS